MFYVMNAQLVCQLLLDKNGIGVITFLIKTSNHIVFTITFTEFDQRAFAI